MPKTSILIISPTGKLVTEVSQGNEAGADGNGGSTTTDFALTGHTHTKNRQKSDQIPRHLVGFREESEKHLAELSDRIRALHTKSVFWYLSSYDTTKADTR